MTTNEDSGPKWDLYEYPEELKQKAAVARKALLEVMREMRHQQHDLHFDGDCMQVLMQLKIIKKGYIHDELEEAAVTSSLLCDIATAQAQMQNIITLNRVYYKIRDQYGYIKTLEEGMV